ncbi:MAG TPA: 4-hydroxythreonine-4-phosphate dehydrogenase PdxA [Devosiaceae bacterium]|jgi:4-hydroxythreonine-4-phosphate dehydrogenase
MAGTAVPPLAISMGEPAGIGPDLILQLYAQRAALSLPAFAVYGNAQFFEARARRLNLSLPIEAVSVQAATQRFDTALPVIEVEGMVPDHPGATSPVSANAVLNAIARAVEDTLRGACRGLVTAPIHKGALYAAGFKHPGHTEYLAELCAAGGTPRLPVMMLAHDDLRAVPLTIHVPLADVPALITTDLVLQTARIVAHDLRSRYGIAAPKLGISGLNPHAGEGGTIGLEELDTIGPAIAQLRHEGIDVDGPVPADTLFFPPHWRRYDAVIAMYHDQALIPIKTVAFEEAVNVTLGLPIVRTSPDHGTAFDLAGTGKGSSASFLAAIRLADKLTAPRP